MGNIHSDCIDDRQSNNNLKGMMMPSSMSKNTLSSSSLSSMYHVPSIQDIDDEEEYDGYGYDYTTTAPPSSEQISESERTDNRSRSHHHTIIDDDDDMDHADDDVKAELVIKAPSEFRCILDDAEHHCDLLFLKRYHYLRRRQRRRNNNNRHQQLPPQEEEQQKPKPHHHYITNYRCFAIVLHDKYGMLLLHCTPPVVVVEEEEDKTQEDELNKNTNKNNNKKKKKKRSKKHNKGPHYQVPGGRVSEQEFIKYDGLCSSRTEQRYLASRSSCARHIQEQTGLKLQPARLWPMVLRNDTNNEDENEHDHEEEENDNNNHNDSAEEAGGEEEDNVVLMNEHKQRLMFVVQVSDGDFLKQPSEWYNLSEARNAHECPLRLKLLSPSSSSSSSLLLNNNEEHYYDYSGFRMETSALRAMAMLKHFQGGRMTKVLGMSLKRQHRCGEEGGTADALIMLLAKQQQQVQVQQPEEEEEGNMQQLLRDEADEQPQEQGNEQLREEDDDDEEEEEAAPAVLVEQVEAVAPSEPEKEYEEDDSVQEDTASMQVPLSPRREIGEDVENALDATPFPTTTPQPLEQEEEEQHPREEEEEEEQQQPEQEQDKQEPPPPPQQQRKQEKKLSEFMLEQEQKALEASGQDFHSESTPDIRNNNNGNNGKGIERRATVVSSNRSILLQNTSRGNSAASCAGDSHSSTASASIEQYANTLAFPSGYQRLLTDATKEQDLSLLLPRVTNALTRQPPLDEDGRIIRYKGFVFVLHETYGMMLLRCKTKLENVEGSSSRKAQQHQKMKRRGSLSDSHRHRHQHRHSHHRHFHYHRIIGGKIEDVDFHGEYKDLSFMAQWYFAAREACARDLKETVGLSVNPERLRPVMLHNTNGATDGGGGVHGVDDDDDHHDHNIEGREEELFGRAPELINEYKKRLFFVLKLTDDEYCEEDDDGGEDEKKIDFSSSVRSLRRREPKLSPKHHPGVKFERISIRAIELLEHFNGGHVSKVLWMALKSRR